MRTKKFVISQRTKPICGEDPIDCTIEDNPEHWVDVELLPPYKYGDKLLKEALWLISSASTYEAPEGMILVNKKLLQNLEKIVKKAEAKS